jgi:hypothetical protein
MNKSTIRILIRTVSNGFVLATLWILIGNPLIQKDSTICNLISLSGTLLGILLFVDLMDLIGEDKD